MNFTREQLDAELHRFVHLASVADLRDLAERKGQGVIGAPLILAMGSRETGLSNIAGDHGHGRGTWQQDDRFQTDWLRHQRGCRSGTNTPLRGHTALEPGFVPTVAAGADRLVTIFVGNYVFVRKQGFSAKTARKIVVSSYNAGLTGALNGQRQFGDSDHNTAHGDYAKDVLARAVVFSSLLKKIK
ncbi:MAG: hypothetical protein QOF36_2589 [Microbacteriaceae bacterium]|jgi:hypothetical protein|nr:hypothetical protein [Microbacteriaceae bacterium]